MSERNLRIINPLKDVSVSMTQVFFIVLLLTVLPVAYSLIPQYYQFLHAVSEIFFVIICFGIFIIAWNVRDAFESSYVAFLGVSFLIVGAFTFVHALTFEGMYLFNEFDTTQISLHFESISIILKSFSLMISPLFLIKKIRARYILIISSIIGSVLFVGAVSPGVFPHCMDNDDTLTPFRKGIEIACTIFLISAVYIHYKFRDEIAPKIFRLMIMGIYFLIPTGLIVYLNSTFGQFEHFVWYLFTFISYIFFYSALIQAGLVEPQAYLFNDLKKSHRSVEKAKKDWEATFDAVPALIAIIDKNYQMTRVNSSMAKVMGVSPQDAVGTKCFEFFHGTDSPHDECPHAKTICQGKTFSLNLHEKKLNGHFQVKTTPIYDENGEVTASIHIAHDVSELKKTEQELRILNDHLELLVESRTRDLSDKNKELLEEINEKTKLGKILEKSESQFKRLSQEFNTLLDGIPDIILLINNNAKVIWANKGASLQLGLAPEKMVGRYCHEIFQCERKEHQEGLGCQECPGGFSFKTLNTEEKLIEFEDGRLINLRSFPIMDELGHSVDNVILIGTDVTEKISLEKEALRSRHLISLGELAAGVAHEINNPINGIINYAQIISKVTDQDSKEYDIASRIISEGDRISAIVLNLLSFARGRQDEKKEFIDISVILEASLSLIDAELRKSFIIVAVNIPENAPMIFANLHQIEQVLLNILSNSRDALNERYPSDDPDKKIDIEVSTVDSGEVKYLKIEIRDYGSGIPEADVNRILDPFYSTKPVGKGTGLGLSISHGIIREHAGTLVIDSVQGEYTSVKILLPTSDEKIGRPTDTGS